MSDRSLGRGWTSHHGLIINPNDGNTVTYAQPFLDGTTDVEGLVFFTSRTDPFGAVLADVFD